MKTANNKPTPTKKGQNVMNSNKQTVVLSKKLYQTWSDEMDADWRAFRERPR